MSAAASVARAQEALRLGRRARIVQRARLAPAHDEDAAQMRFVVEDALNTADFGDCGRLIVVRRLRLQAVPPRAGPALMSRALEAAWRALAARAVSADEPISRDADAVFFSSRVQARLDWLKRAAARADVSAWYWSAALPELKHAVSAGDVQASMAVVIEVLVQESLVEVMQAFRCWPDGIVAALARQLPSDGNRRLLEVFTEGATQTPMSPAGPAARVAVARRIDVEWHPVVSRLARQAPLSEAAASWIAALWLAPVLRRTPTILQVQAVVARSVWLASAGYAGEWAESVDQAVSVGASSVVGDVDPVRRTSQVLSPLLARSSQSAESASTTPGAAGDSPPIAWHVESGLQPVQRSSSNRHSKRGHSPLALPWLADAATTDHGGLLCLVNLLQSLRFARWLDAQAQKTRLPFVNALFVHALTVCQAPHDDPQFAWFAPSESDAAALSGARFVDGTVAMDTSLALRTWCLRMRRTLRRHVGVDLREVVLRAAWVSGTATHLDVVFPLDEVDLRLRRCSLDSDPGWVPWFGRIVAFHFVDSELLPQRQADQGAPDG